MPATCERCGEAVDRVWKATNQGATEWVCRECHPELNG